MLLGAMLALAACIAGVHEKGAGSFPSPERETSVTLKPEVGLGKVAFVRAGEIYVQDLPSGLEVRVAEGKAPRWSPDGRWVYFSSGKEGWRVRPDGSDLQRIGALGLLSPRGDRLAYVMEGGLLVAAPDGSQSREILPLGSGVQRFLWAPDGNRLVVEVERRLVLSVPPNIPTEWGLWLVNWDGSGLSLLHSGWDPQQPYTTGSCLGREGSGSGNPTLWSPDGGYLAFWRCGISGSFSADGGELWIVSVQDGKSRRIGRSLFYQDFLSWSPDGRLLAFVDPSGRDTWGYFPQGRPQGKQIKVAEAATGQVRDLTANPSNTYLYPSFSPDGKHIAYSSAPVVPYVPKEYASAQGAGARRIWVMNADGSGKRQLTDDPGYADERPLWSKDGRFILFVRRLAVDVKESLRAELWIMGADGSNKRRVAEGLDGAGSWFGYYGHIAWDDLFAWYQGN